jgi:hypothetical protein
MSNVVSFAPAPARVNKVVEAGKIGRKLPTAAFEVVGTLREANALIAEGKRIKKEADPVLAEFMDTFEFGTWKNINVVKRIHVRAGAPKVNFDLLLKAFPEAYAATVTPFQSYSYLKV